MTQPPDDHLKALWQGQETETSTMTAMAIRALARNYGDNIRGRIWIGVTLAGVELLMFSVMAWRAPNDLSRTGYLVILAGVVWLTWRIVSRWPSRMPPIEASTATLIEFHRAQLQRQQPRLGWLALSVAPMFVGIAVTVVGLLRVRPNTSWLNAAPVVVLSLIWWLVAVITQRRQARRVAEQIAEMDELGGR